MATKRLRSKIAGQIKIGLTTSQPKRNTQLKFLLYALQKYQDHPVIDYFCRTVLSCEYWLKTRPFFISAILISTATALVILTIAAYILTIAIYFLIPNYIDHGQPVVASISWLWMQGHDLYPNWET